VQVLFFPDDDDRFAATVGEAPKNVDVKKTQVYRSAYLCHVTEYYYIDMSLRCPTLLPRLPSHYVQLMCFL
jgi:hypothetical protein